MIPNELKSIATLNLWIHHHFITWTINLLIFKHTFIICLIAKSDHWKNIKLQTIKFKQFETIFLYQKIIIFKRFQMNWKATLNLWIHHHFITWTINLLFFKHTTIICFVIICLITKSDDWKNFKLHQTIKFKQFETIFLYQKIHV